MATKASVPVVVRPRSAPDLEVRLDPGHRPDLQVIHHDPAPAQRPGNRFRPIWLFPGALALSLLLTGAVNAPGSADEPVRTRAEALRMRTVQPSASLPLSGHPASTPVRLIGASEHGVAVWQGSATGSGATVYTGPLAGPDGTMQLTARPGTGVGTQADSLVRLSVTGRMLSWYELGGERRGNTYPQEHRIDLATGENGAGALAVRERRSDATTPYTQIDPGGQLAGPARPGWLEFGDRSARIVTYQGRWGLEYQGTGHREVHRVALPPGVTANSGLDLVGDRFYTASSGDHPAVYLIQADRVTKVAEIPAARHRIASWALAAGSVHYTDRSVPPPGKTSVFTSPLAVVDGQIELGPSSALRQRAGRSRSKSVPIAASAGRSVLRAPGASERWQLIDQGTTTGVAVQRAVELPDGGRGTVTDDSPAVSGAYALIGGQVFRPDGELAWIEPAAAALDGHDDLYGAEIVYSVPEGGTDLDGTDLAGVWSVNAERPLPIRLDTSTCEQAPLVAVWAGRAAWTSCDAGRISVQDLRTGQIRDIATGLGVIIGSDPQPITGLTLREGVLAWRDGEALSLVDLSREHSTPVVLPGATTRFALDGDLVVREVRMAQDTELLAQRLPFPVNPRPRLIAAAAPLGFSPDGDGRYDLWKPQFDVTRPVRDATLRILAPSGRVVRTFALPGGGDGSLRGVVWDGRSGTGKKLAEDTYTWELSARAVAGSGTLTSAESPARSRGTIEISRAG